MDEFDECNDECLNHANNCDGFCTHTNDHKNMCLTHPYEGM